MCYANTRGTEVFMMGRHKKEEELVPGQLTIWDFCTDAKHFVVQANRLIQGKQALKLNSAKLIRAAIMQIKPDDTSFGPYIVKVGELAEMFGIDPSNIYKYADEITDDIISNPVFIKEEEGGKITKFVKVPWVQYCEYSKDHGIAIQLNDKLKPFLLGLKEHYAQYTLDSILSMKSVYSIRIYELLQSKIIRTKHRFKEKIVSIPVNEIREICDIMDKYDRFSSFKTRVLDIAVKEINDQTQWKIGYSYKTVGKKVNVIDFLISEID